MKSGEDSLALASVQSFLLEQGFAKFKLPERVESFAHLPRNALG
jgi:non-ribosomal peptide synthetase component E (peptide arylation enzyme)